MTFVRFASVVAFVTLAACTDGDRVCPVTDFAEREPAQLVRDPQTGVCQSIGAPYCDEECGPCPAYEIAIPDWATCYGSCEGLDESSCKSASGCRAVYAGNTFHQCWGVAPSGPIQTGTCEGLDANECSRHDNCIARHAVGSPIGGFQSCHAETSIQDPGSCVGEVACDALPPACPSGTIPGRRNGCWTGYCIPYEQCDELPACSTLGESDCIARTDCAPTYEGQNCTCNGTSCTCQTWVFDSCKAN